MRKTKNAHTPINLISFCVCVRRIYTKRHSQMILWRLADAKKEAEIDDRYEIEIVHESTN